MGLGVTGRTYRCPPGEVGDVDDIPAGSHPPSRLIFIKVVLVHVR